MDIAISKNNVPIRLTKERWLHISTGHPEITSFYDQIFESIEYPEIIYKGNEGELLATKTFEVQHKIIFIVVVYKETSYSDGFVITAFITNKIGYLEKKEILWKQQK